MSGERPAGAGLLGRLARLVIAHPRGTIVAWAVATAVGAVLASGLFGELANRGFLVAGSQSDLAARALNAHFPGRRGTPLLVVVRQRPVRRGTFPRGWTADAMAALVRRALRDVPEVRHVERTGYSIAYGQDGSLASKTVLVAFDVAAEPAAAERQVPRYRAAVAHVAGPGRSVALFGGVVVTQRYASIARSDLQRAERIAFPFTLAVLLVAFMSVVASALPLLLAAVVLVVTFACLFAIGAHAGLSVFVTNTSSILALALSIDFALFMITRLREEVLRGASVQSAVARTMTSTGRAIALSGLTIAIALLALFVVGIDLFSSMAIGATLATLVAALAALTLLPAVLLLLGPRVDWLRIDGVARAARRATLWHRLADVVTGHPLACVVGVVAVMLAAAAPVRSIHLDLHTVDALARHDVVRRAAEDISHAFYPGAPGPVEVVTSHATVPRALGRDRSVVQTWGETYGTHGWFAMQIVLLERPDSEQARREVVRLRHLYAREPGRTYLDGPSAAAVDLLDRLGARTPWVIGLTIAVGAIVLCVGLRSLVVPLKAVLGTLLSVAATIGIVLRLFPSTSSGRPSLEFFVPLFLFAIVFGLSVDYEVFLLSRIREAVLRGRSNAEAVREGLVRSARPITLAGITLATVFVGMATSSLVAFQQLGVGLAIAIVLDVTLVRCVLVPAGIVLLGRWNWWFFEMHAPRPVDRRAGADGGLEDGVLLRDRPQLGLEQE